LLAAAAVSGKVYALGGSNGAAWLATAEALDVTPPWTLMFYLDGDNNLSASYGPVFNQLELAAGNPDVNVVALLDQAASGDSAYYKVKHDTDTSRFAAYTDGVDRFPQGEVDMGSPATLANFVAWAKANYPAQRYALILDDHGNGVSGGLVDDTAKSTMSVKGIAAALSAASAGGAARLDVLVMNMCLMGMVEDAYEFAPYADHYVASENEQWTYTTGYAAFVSAVSATTTPAAFAATVAAAYANDAAAQRRSYTMSAASLARASDVAAAASGLALALTPQMTATAGLLTSIRQAVQRYDNAAPLGAINTSDQIIDLYDFAQRVKAAYPDAPTQNAAQAVMDAVSAYVLAEQHASFAGSYALGGSHGVSIFFPPTRSSFYNGTNLAFAAGTSWPGLVTRPARPGDSTIAWGDMLVAYFQVTQPGGPDDPNLPPPVSKLVASNLYLPFIRR
jgi:hypothetical protein